jgi:hypothetical protein
VSDAAPLRLHDPRRDTEAVRREAERLLDGRIKPQQAIAWHLFIELFIEVAGENGPGELRATLSKLAEMLPAIKPTNDGIRAALKLLDAAGLVCVSKTTKFGPLNVKLLCPLSTPPQRRLPGVDDEHDDTQGQPPQPASADPQTGAESGPQSGLQTGLESGLDAAHHATEILPAAQDPIDPRFQRLADSLSRSADAREARELQKRRSTSPVSPSAALSVSSGTRDGFARAKEGRPAPTDDGPPAIGALLRIPAVNAEGLREPSTTDRRRALVEQRAQQIIRVVGCPTHAPEHRFGDQPWIHAAMEVIGGWPEAIIGNSIAHAQNGAGEMTPGQRYQAQIKRELAMRGLPNAPWGPEARKLLERVPVNVQPHWNCAAPPRARSPPRPSG